ncbi:hypothetical protein RHSIM_Rhsim12G0007100 [Rhododendron simsii]|uniref:TMEM205-like domain-containing protein n=1 Tax=Rhododendron simsii TaxID=118357 RepID=A0A834G8K3_RHOSS|nr:hypothetical protein RHSIM_Rhsim12G0007100 [Rhododendron simsii]
MMINVVALSLVLSSLVTSCVLSPTQETHTPKQDDVVIVKEGHRAVIVEYEKEGTDGNTKVSISPKPISGEEELSTAAAATTAKDAVEEAKQEVKERGRGPRELACDAFGKCEHRIASVIGKAKEKVTEKVHAVEEGAKEAVGEVVGKAKETLSHATGDVSEIAKDTAEKAKTMGKDVQRNVSATIESAKEKAKENAEKGKEMAEQAAERARTGGNRVKEGGEKVFKEILRSGRDVAAAMDWVVGVVHLLGFSTAYGICLWVTFVSGYVLAGTLPRQQFAMVQSRIYPVYFRVMAISVCVALVGHLLGRRGKLFTSKGEMLQGFHLLASLLMILINSFYLEP